MTPSASPAAAEAATPAEALALLRFPSGLRLTPDQFALLCAENRDAVLELAADGRRSIEPTRCRCSGTFCPARARCVDFRLATHNGRDFPLKLAGVLHPNRLAASP